MRLRLLLLPGALLMSLLLVPPAAAYQLNTGCELDYEACLSRARAQHGADDPCTAYNRCRANDQCQADRCVCLRTGGNQDPAEITTARAVCNSVLRPHVDDGCHRKYGAACSAWIRSQQERPRPPANPSPGPDASAPLPPDQMPR